jgi:hypothetical protein
MPLPIRLRRVRSLVTRTALMVALTLLPLPSLRAADTITVDSGPPDPQPLYSCLGAPHYLRVCAGEWMRLVHDRKPIKDRTTYWHAAEFQGFIDGTIRAQQGRVWCPGVMESHDQIYAIVAEYLVARGSFPEHMTATQAVIMAMSSSRPCK